MSFFITWLSDLMRQEKEEDDWHADYKERSKTAFIPRPHDDIHKRYPKEAKKQTLLKPVSDLTMTLDTRLKYKNQLHFYIQAMDDLKFKNIPFGFQTSAGFQWLTPHRYMSLNKYWLIEITSQELRMPGGSYGTWVEQRNKKTCISHYSCHSFLKTKQSNTERYTFPMGESE